MGDAPNFRFRGREGGGGDICDISIQLSIKDRPPLLNVVVCDIVA